MRSKWWIIPVALVALYVIFRITGFLQFYHVPTASNEPNIHVGSWLFATNLNKPKRFDFICYRQAAGSGWPEGIWVKRLCGLPGDKVQLIDGILYVNGRNADSDLDLKKTYVIPSREENKLGEDFLNKQRDDIRGMANDSEAVILETDMIRRTSIAGHFLVDTSTEGIDSLFGHRWSRDNFGPLRVSEGHYFVLGDNRDQSADSRYAGLTDTRDYLGTVFSIFK